jgi:hypothetical protein
MRIGQLATAIVLSLFIAGPARAYSVLAHDRISMRRGREICDDGVFFSRIIMHAVSKDARFIVDRMEPDRCYQASDLRALLPHASAEGFREVMHELWVNRQVERVGYSGWQRHRSAPAHQGPVDAQHDGPISGFRQTKVVKPEDLFDHGSFADFFR